MFGERIPQEFIFICEYLKYFIRNMELNGFRNHFFFFKATFGLEHLFQLLFFITLSSEGENFD